MTLPIHAFRMKFAGVALGALVLASGHAVAKNHDCQTFKPSSAAVTLHDRAPGPLAGLPG